MYKVYRHTSPNGKCYIGITMQQDPRRRWEKGKRYNHNEYFWRAIQKYGWDNIKHEILYENLTKEEACQIEIELIKKYMDLNLSYNLSTGGEHPGAGIHHKRRGGWHHSEETKRKISEANKLIERKKTGPRSDEVKEKISKANKGKWGWNKGLHWSDEVKEKISKSNKGKQVSGETRKKQSQARLGKSPWNKGLKTTEETRKKQSESKKEFYKNNKVIWINNGIKNTRIREDLIDDYLKDGWQRGRLKNMQS